MSDKTLHPAVIKQVNNRKIKHIFTGGGVGIALYVVDKNGKESILKISTSDGLNNGRRKLIREANQVMYLKNRYPQINVFLPKIIKIIDGKDFAIVEYPFYKGKTFASMVADKNPSTIKLTYTLRKIVNLCIGFYLLNYRKRENHFLENKNILRAKFRVGYIHSKNPKINKVANARKLSINDRWYINPGLLIEKISANESFIKKIRPKYLGDCMHGDLNLTNVMINGDKIIFLDFRGSRQKWDLAYDLAKMAFTSGYESIRTNRIKPEIQKDGGVVLKFIPKDSSLLVTWESLLFKFEDIIEKDKLFAQIRKNDPYWKTRLRLSFALHYLADSACRLVAGSLTSQPLASFLVGTVYLNRFASDLKSQMPASTFYSMRNFLLP